MAGRVNTHPCNIEAEQGLLGALLLNNALIEKVGHLAEHHFYEPFHGRLFKLIGERIDAGKMASPVSLKPFLVDDPGLPDLGGTEYVARLAASAISLAAVKDYAETIIEMSARRDLIAGLEEALATVATMGEMDRAAERVDEALMSARFETQERPATITFPQAVSRAGNQMNEAYQRGTGVDIPTGIPELDKALGGFSNDEMIVLGGRPSMGKSALAIEIMRRQAQAGLWCVYWSSEMSEEAVALRVLSAHAERGAAFGPAQRGQMSEDQFRAMLEAGVELESLPIRIVDSGLRTLPRILREIRRNVRRIRDNGGEIGSVIIDYIQQIMPVHSRGRFDVVTEISMAIKAMQMELRVPVLALSQLSRKVEERENKRPMLSDLRESGQLEQDANKVLFCYRDEYYLARQLSGVSGDKAAEIEEQLANVRGLMEAIISKQRTGPLTTVDLGYDPARNLIRPLAYQWDSQEGMPF